MKRRSAYIIRIAFSAAIGGFLLGFDGSVISGALPFYKLVFGLSEGSILLGFSVSCIIWGAIFGNLIAGQLSDRYGRKKALYISAILFACTGLICALSNNIWVFIFGRIVGGVGVGIAILVAPVYIAEIAPAKSRGSLVSFNQLLIVIGLSAAYFSNYFILKAVKDPLLNWRWMLGVESFPAILYLIAIFFIPESPRWLIMQGNDENGLTILKKVDGEHHAQSEYTEIKKSIGTKTDKNLFKLIRELFSGKMKKVLIIGFGLGILQQFSGINAILYYAPMVFESAGGGRNAAFLQAVILGIVFVIMTIVSMFLIDRVGRKPLLYTGVTMMALSLSVTGFLFRENGNIPIHSTAVLFSILGFIAGFSISLGPVMWAMFAEIFPNKLRGFAISVVGASNAIASFLVATFFPYQLTTFGKSATYFIYAFLMFFCLWFIKRFVVETRGKSLEQIESELIKV